MMPYEYSLPDKINAILHVMKAVIELSEGHDSSDPVCDGVKSLLEMLSTRLLTEIDSIKGVVTE